MRTSRGFTLIELVVTIVVLTIISMIAVPNFQKLKDRQRVGYSSKEFEKTLLQARYDALLHRKSITVHLNQSGTATPTDLYWAISSNETLVFRKLKCESSVWKDDGVITGVDQLSFSKDGNAKLSRSYKDDDDNDQRDAVTATFATIEVSLSSNDEENYIEITPFGKVTVSKASKEGKECS